MKKRNIALFATAIVGTLGLFGASVVPAGASTTAADGGVIATVLVKSGGDGDSTFKIKLTDPAVIAQARADMAPDKEFDTFPIGKLVRGTAENTGYSWHLTDVKFTEMAIELCDATPIYVEQHMDDFPTYCPWGGDVIAVDELK